MIEKIRAMVREKDLCVMATVSGSIPHCSLMAYVAAEGADEIYMATLRNTTKYRNLIQNPSVSLLVDTREETPPSKRAGGQALTIQGVFEKIEEQGKRKWAIARLKERHPGLEAFFSHPDAEPFRIKVKSFLFLDGPTDSHFEEV